MCSKNCPCKDVPEKVDWVLDRSREWDFDGTYTVYKDCIEDPSLSKSIPFKAWAAEFTQQENYQSIQSWITFFEDEFNCAGFCQDVPFFWSKSISVGPPPNACLGDVNDELTRNFKMLGVTAIFLGCLLFCMFFIQYCLWRKFDSSGKADFAVKLDI